MVRTRRDCPYPGCTSKDLVRLANHLESKHKLSAAEKKPYLLSAKTQRVVEASDLLSEEKGTPKLRPDKMTPDASPVKRDCNELAIIPLQPCSSIIICGVTNTGKSRFTKRLVEECSNMYDPNPPEKILYCYGVYSSLYEEMEREQKNIQFHHGMPTEQSIDEYSGGKHTLVIFDDLMSSV